MTLIETDRTTWTAVCHLAELTPGRGVAALVDGTAVAVFRLADDTVRVIGNLDGCSGASVLARGIVGETVVDGRTVRYVASPLRKQRFDLCTGRCLDAAAEAGAWDARVVDGIVQVASPASRSGNGPETTS